MFAFNYPSHGILALPIVVVSHSTQQSLRSFVHSTPKICRPTLTNVTTKIVSTVSPPFSTSPALKLVCCSLQTLSFNAVALAPSFASCQLFPPCRNLFAHSSIQNVTFDGNELAQKGAHTQTRMAHKSNNYKVVRRRQWTQKCTQHSAKNA